MDKDNIQKQHARPEGHWNWSINVTRKHDTRYGNMIWVGAQTDLTPHGKVLNPDDLEAQTANLALSPRAYPYPVLLSIYKNQALPRRTSRYRFWPMKVCV